MQTNKTKEILSIQDAIECVLDLADDGLAHYEEKGFQTTDDIVAKSVAIKRVRNYFKKLQENLVTVKQEAHAIYMPTDLDHKDWRVIVLASAITIDDMITDLLILGG